MIVNIAGTSGSGKTTVIRGLLEHVTKQTPVYRDREQPIGYDLVLPGVKGLVHLVGSYEPELVTGGCDSFSNIPLVFGLIREQLEAGKHVVYEGILVMNMTRGPQLSRDYPGQMHVLSLTTPLSTCLAGINARRADKGKGEFVKVKNMQDNYKRSFSYASTMRQAGARVHAVTRDTALTKLLDILQGTGRG